MTTRVVRLPVVGGVETFSKRDAGEIMVIYNVWALAVVVPAIMLFEGNDDKAMKAAFILMIPLDLALRGAMAYSRRALGSQVWIEMMILPSYGVAIFFLPVWGWALLLAIL